MPRKRQKLCFKKVCDARKTYTSYKEAYCNVQSRHCRSSLANFKGCSMSGHNCQHVVASLKGVVKTCFGVTRSFIALDHGIRLNLTCRKLVKCCFFTSFAKNRTHTLVSNHTYFVIQWRGSGFSARNVSAFLCLSERGLEQFQLDCATCWNALCKQYC